MFSHHTDINKNILYLTIQGKLELDEVRRASQEIIQESKRLRPGFGVISDISTFVPASEEGRVVMQNTMKTFMEAGMKCAVRVVPSSAIVPAMQFQRTSRIAGYEALEAPTLKEAEQLILEIL